MTGYLEKARKRETKEENPEVSGGRLVARVCPSATWKVRGGRAQRGASNLEFSKATSVMDRAGQVSYLNKMQKEKKHRRAGWKSMGRQRGYVPWKRPCERGLRRVSMLAIFPGKCQGCLIRFLLCRDPWRFRYRYRYHLDTLAPSGSLREMQKHGRRSLTDNSCPNESSPDDLPSPGRVRGMHVSARLGKRTLVFLPDEQAPVLWRDPVAVACRLCMFLHINHPPPRIERRDGGV